MSLKNLTYILAIGLISSFTASYCAISTLHEAIRENGADLQGLLDDPQALNERDIGRNTPLHTAVMYGRKDMVEFLLKKGAVFGANIHKYTYNGDLNKVKSILKTNPELVNADDYGWTPLHYAAARNHEHIVKFLIANGATINPKDGTVCPPLDLAVSNGHENIAKLLIDSGANVNAKNNLSVTVLMRAAEFTQKDIAELLISKGANVDARDKWKWTPLHYACYRGGKEIVQLLITKGADINAKHIMGNGPLSWAVQYKHKEIADLLRKHGAVE